MGKTVAIDLGTTNSSVAIYEVHEKKGLVFDNLKTTVITDSKNATTQPSVVAFDVAEKPGKKWVVGHLAKQRQNRRLREGEHPPISFVKREMEFNRVYPIGDGATATASEISGYIVHHMVRLAERQLGETVESVLITVPAYFNLAARQKTMEAANTHANRLREEEGLPRIKTLEPVLEPVAAATAYCANDDRENLRIMVFDLGGGTFDVTILEKRDGVFKVVRTETAAGFGGDPRMGGYNFDKKIVDMLLGELVSTYPGLQDLDESDPLQKPDKQDQVADAGRAIVNTFMYVAELAKIAVNTGDHGVYEIHHDFLCEDKTGAPVNIHNREFSRAEFNRMVDMDVRDMITECHRVLREVAVSVSELDEIVLVGGSTRIGLISEYLTMQPYASKDTILRACPGIRLEELEKATTLQPVLTGNKDDTDEMYVVPDHCINSIPVKELYGGLGKSPKLFMPDLAVVLGAAQIAGMSEEWIEPVEGFRVKKPTSPTPMMDVCVEGTADTSVTGLTGAKRVVFLRQDGREYDAELKDSGEFLAVLDLVENQTNDFDVILKSDDGAEIARCEVSVVQKMRVPPPPPPPPVYLTKSLSIRTLSGLEVIAREGSVLPLENTLTKRAAHTAQTRKISIELLEGNVMISDIGISFPEEVDVREDMPVELSVKVSSDGIISAHSSIEIDGQTYPFPTTITVSPREVRNRKELERNVEILKEQCRDIESQDSGPNARMMFVTPLIEKLQACVEELSKPTLDNVKIEEYILAITELLEAFKRRMKWDPPFGEFELLVEATLDLLDEELSKAQSASKRQVLLSLKMEVEAAWELAKIAYERGDRDAWKEQYSNVKNIYHKLLPPVPDEDRKQWMLESIRQWRERIQKIRSTRRYNDCDEMLESLNAGEREILKIDTSWSDAALKLVTVYGQRVKPVRVAVDEDLPFGVVPVK